MKRWAIVLSLVLVASAAEGAETPLVVDLWPGQVPGDNPSTIGPEKFLELKVNGKTYEVGGKPTKWLTNVTHPTITLRRPPKDRDNGTAVLICPGGGYHNLGWDVEGEEVAAWLNSLGVTGVILKYRVPRRPGDVKGEPAPGPLKDAQRAVSLVRSRAKEWGIDPQRIGMVGFSAGGHLALAAATHFDKRAYDPSDDVDQVSCRPDFAIAAYSGYLAVKDTYELAPYIRVPAETPPVFLVHASDDTISDVANSVVMYQALKRAKVPVELHVYASGGHGFAVRDVGQPCSTWTRNCVDWLRSRGVLRDAP